MKSMFEANVCRYVLPFTVRELFAKHRIPISNTPRKNMRFCRMDTAATTIRLTSCMM